MNNSPRATLTAGAKFRAAVAAEKPLQVVGAINAYVARMAEATGFRALYLSGGGVAANSLGLPDLGISTMDDVLIDIRRITEASSLPLLVDADTGWGGAFNIARTVRSFTKAGAAGMHIEDQVQSKRCGHRPGKEVVPKDEMVDRIKACVDARTDSSFVIMARSDALASRGLDEMIARLVACVEAGAAGFHIEDQVQSKRCGHRPGKEVVGKDEMVDRIKACVDARTDASFVVMARSDALASHGLDEMIARLVACVEAGADAVFPEAITDLAMYRKVREAVRVPVLANITEFGRTPLYTREELGAAGVDIVLHCCSAYRAMNLAALEVYQAIRRDGTQKNVLGDMQTRDELYEYLDYHAYERKLDDLFSAGKEKGK